MKFFNKNYKVVLAVLAVSFIAVSLLLHTFENYFWYRFIRGIYCYAILVFLLFVHGKNAPKWLVGFLVFNGASCITMAWFENQLMASVTMILAFISFLTFFWYVIPKVKIAHFTKVFSLLFIIILGVNGYLFFRFIEAMRDFALSETQYIFTLLSGITGSLLGFFALFHNHIYNSSQSMSFMILVLLLIFSGVFRGIGYYDLVFGSTFVYLARILYALSLCVLVYFSFLEVKNQKDIENINS